MLGTTISNRRQGSELLLEKFSQRMSLSSTGKISTTTVIANTRNCKATTEQHDIILHVTQENVSAVRTTLK